MEGYTFSVYRSGVFESELGALLYVNIVEAVTCFERFVAMVKCCERLDPYVDMSAEHFHRRQLVEAALSHLSRIQQYSSDESEVCDMCGRGLRLAFKDPIKPEDPTVWHYPFLSGCSLVRNAYRLGIAEGLEAALQVLWDISGYLSSSTMALIVSNVCSIVEKRCRLV